MVVAAAVAAFPVVGYMRWRTSARVDLAQRDLERQRIMYLSLQERHNNLLTGLASSKPSASRNPAASSEAADRRLLARAGQEFLRGNYTEALADSARVLENTAAPDDVLRAAHVRTLVCLVALSRWDEAMTAAEGALASFPDCQPLLQAKADVLIYLGHLDEAEGLITSLCRESGGAAAVFARGNLSWALGHTKRAEEDLKSVVSSGVPLLEKAAANNLALLWAGKPHGRQKAYFYLSLLSHLAPAGYTTDRTAGRVYLLTGELARAERLFLKCLSKNRRDFSLLLDLAELYEAKGKEGLCREYRNEALSIDSQCLSLPEHLRGAWLFAMHQSALPRQRTAKKKPGDADALLLKARGLVEANQPHEARKRIEAALEAAPDDPRVLFFAATFANATGNAIAARSFYLRVLADDGGNLSALKGLAATALTRGRFERAAEWARVALAAAPGDLLLLDISAKAHFACGRWEKALERSREFLKAGGKETTNTAFILATCLKIRGAPAREVIDHYRRALLLDGANTAAANDLAFFMATTGRAAEATRLADKLVALTARAPHALDTAAFVHYRAGNLQTAQKLVDEALTTRPMHPEVLLHGALVYRALGEEKKSRRLYEKARDAAAGKSELLKTVELEYENG